MGAFGAMCNDAIKKKKKKKNSIFLFYLRYEDSTEIRL